ncbi:metallo-beta-lactamase superfamily protein, partial [Rhizoctonia solani]
MDGDACHHGGQPRPTKNLPLSEYISPNPFPNESNGAICPGALLLPIHPTHNPTEPFYRVSKLPGGAAKTDPVEAQESLDKMKEMDGHDNVLTIIAHDTTWLDVLKFFPENLYDWKTEGYKARGMDS